ncbi:hypothetical protein [Pseudomonas juntendi]|uniref:hypothetical protein n=1 Tax=Pseudomonas juntendi TaxID=2666183 RepID=UPI003B92FF5D
MTIDKEKLKHLAGQSALEPRWYEAGSHGLKNVCYLPDREFIAAASPATVLALLAEISRIEIDSAYVAAGSRTRAEVIDQFKAENEALRSAALAAREFIIHEAEVRGLLDENGQVSHRHPRRQATIAKIDAAMAKESSHD